MNLIDPGLGEKHHGKYQRAGCGEAGMFTVFSSRAGLTNAIEVRVLAA